MERVIPRRTVFVCRSCKSLQALLPVARRLSTLTSTKHATHPRARTTPRAATLRTHYRQKRDASDAAYTETLEDEQEQPQRSVRENVDVPKSLAKIRKDAARIINSNQVPRQIEVLDLLEGTYALSKHLVFGDEHGPPHADAEVTARTTATETTASDTSSALLDDLDESASKRQRPASMKVTHRTAISSAFRNETAKTLASIAYHLLRAPQVPLTENILQFYVRIQCLLGRPEYLPEIFDMYAHKPSPSQRNPSSPITYTNTRSWAPRNAIPLPLAEAALSAAMHKRDMGLAIAITDTTVATTAYQSRRFLTQAFPKLSLLSIIPFSAYTAADWASTYQNTFDPEMAKTMALMGSAAYIGTFGVIAYTAVTTWSDHHDRVHWEAGQSLYQRWLREDERLFMDRIALAWGFEDKKRRGEEQGQEWEALRDSIGLRGMVLDKTEFMEGFN